MNRRLLITKDGSVTIEFPETEVTYHSRHGALQESMHVYIQAGLGFFKTTQTLKVLEIGFGTGLNALLSLDYTQQQGISIHYTGIEKFPLEEVFYRSLNYVPALHEEYLKMHHSNWNQPIQLTDAFILEKREADVAVDPLPTNIDCIFYDAFAPSSQPELWKTDIFKKLFDCLNSGGILVTYCSKSSVQREMKEAGFRIEKMQGPKWKREMIRAHKL